MKELAAALAKAQKAFKHISRDKTVTVRTRTGSAYTFSYAPLESIMAAIKDALAANEIALLQDVFEGRVRTILSHSSGDQYVSSGTPIKVSEASTAQEYGSGLTYARRYDISLTLGLCPDDDDDGNAASGNEATVAEKGRPAAPITPTTGCFDGIDPDRVELVNRIADGLKDALHKGAWDDAYQYLYVENLHAGKINNDELVCVWDILKPYSMARNKLKKIDDMRRKLAEQA